MIAKEPLFRRLVRHMVYMPSGCVEWSGFRSKRGYGRLRMATESNYPDCAQAHRVAYEFFVGPIPAGMCLDHLCRNRACVRPDHLEPVTPAENSRRGVRATAQFCFLGHPFDEANTLRQKGGGSRICRECHRRRGLQTQSRKKASRIAS